MPSHESDPAPTSVSFVEEASGFIDFDEADYDAAYRAGAAAGRRLTLRLRITADDAERFVADRRRAARVDGWVRGDALGGPMEVEDGEFEVLAGRDGTRRLGYRLRVRDGTGRALTITGHKSPFNGVPPALRVRVLDGQGERGAVVATGILEMPGGGLAAQVATFRVTPPLRLDTLARFGALVVGDHWDSHR
jgi:cholesterol oxidase